MANPTPPVYPFADSGPNKAMMEHHTKMKELKAMSLDDWTIKINVDELYDSFEPIIVELSSEKGKFEIGAGCKPVPPKPVTFMGIVEAVLGWVFK